MQIHPPLVNKGEAKGSFMPSHLSGPETNTRSTIHLCHHLISKQSSPSCKANVLTTTFRFDHRDDVARCDPDRELLHRLKCNKT